MHFSSLQQVIVSEDDIRRQELKVIEARKKLQDAIKGMSWAPSGSSYLCPRSERRCLLVVSDAYYHILCVIIWMCNLFLAIEDKKKFIDAVHVQDCRPYLCTIKSFSHSLHWFFFSSPELKAQVRFFDHLSSVVCLSVRPSVCKLFTFSSSSPEPLGQFQPNLAQSILGWRGFKFVQMKGPALFPGEIITK